MSNRQNEFLSSRFVKPTQLNEISSHTQPFKYLWECDHVSFTKYVKSPGIQSLMNNHGIKPTTKPESRATKTPSPYHKPQYSMDKSRSNLQFLSKRDESQ